MHEMTLSLDTAVWAQHHQIKWTTHHESRLWKHVWSVGVPVDCSVGFDCRGTPSPLLLQGDEPDWGSGISSSVWRVGATHRELLCGGSLWKLYTRWRWDIIWCWALREHLLLGFNRNGDRMEQTWQSCTNWQLIIEEKFAGETWKDRCVHLEWFTLVLLKHKAPQASRAKFCEQHFQHRNNINNTKFHSCLICSFVLGVG